MNNHTITLLLATTFCTAIATLLCARLFKQPATSHNRSHQLDGLRGVLACAVIAHHFYYNFTWREGGQLGRIANANSKSGRGFRVVVFLDERVFAHWQNSPFARYKLARIFHRPNQTHLSALYCRVFVGGGDYLIFQRLNREKFARFSPIHGRMAAVSKCWFSRFCIAFSDCRRAMDAGV